jgi:hypothetical protein
MITPEALGRFNAHFRSAGSITVILSVRPVVIASYRIRGSGMMFGSFPASKALTHEGDGFHYQGQLWKEFSEEGFPATFLDDEKVRGIVFMLPLGDGVYPIEAVLEMDEEDPLLGVLFVPIHQ